MVVFRSVDRRHFASLLGLSLILGCKPAETTRRLVVGMELGYPPFEMTDEQGRPAGVSVDLARALAESLQRELVLENIAFDGLIPALKTGRIDLILSSLTRTEERAQSIDFSDPYLETGLCLLVSKSSPVESVSDLDQPGRKVAVKKGTTGHAYAAANLKKAEVLVLDKEAAAVLEVVQSKVDAFIYDQFSTLQHWQRNEATTRAILKPFQTERWAIGLRKGDDTLRSAVNRFLAEYRQRGGFDQLAERWLKTQKDAFQRQNLPFVF